MLSESAALIDYLDLQIQFRLAKSRSTDGLQSTHDVVATINGSGSWRSESTVDFAQLAAAEAVPRQYGSTLGEMLFRPAIMNALRQARGVAGRPVRIRLWLETGPKGERENQHGLRWERAFVPLNGRDWPLAITPDLPFSRYVPAESIDPDPSSDSVFRLLVVFANPERLLDGMQPVEVEADLTKLLDGFGPLTQGRRFRLKVLPGRTGLSQALRDRLAASQIELVEGLSTMDAITDAVHDCHGLHIVAHGVMNPQTKRGALALEGANARMAFAFDDDLYPWIHPDLRCVVLQSCQSAAPTPADGPPFVGIGPRLVQLGVPAVVAMQDFVAMDDARVFAATFYRSLVRDGVVDAAVNDGRNAIFLKSANDNFSIPVLFMRLKGGLLWRPDPLRNAVRARLDEVGPQPLEPLPTRAIQSLRPTLAYDPEVGPPGALFDMPAKLADLSAEKQALVLLVGARGMAKGLQLQWLYRDVAQRFLDDDSTAPAPVMLTLREIAEARSVTESLDRILSTLAGTPRRTQAWAARPLLLIVDGDEELGEDDLREALRLVKDFRQGSQHRFVVSLDEGSREIWDQDLEPTAVLVAKPMDFDRVCLYLKRLNTPAANQLREVIEQRRCRDIAGTPWLLERMIALSQRKVSFDSRATLLRQIANECLTSVPMGGVPRFCAERGLEQVGWQMQWGRTSMLGGADLYRVLADARGNREFRLGDLKDLLIRSGVLAAAGEDAVRFRYQSLQAYYAARYLAASPERRRLLEDITASLGRLARARWWEKTLVTMAGLDGPSSKGILSAILAGSPLVEGEQVFLAARCYLEVRDAGDPPTGLVDQIADALIWRSHPGNLRPYADRERSVSALAELRHPNAIPHLMSLACDQMAVGWGTEKRYEFSGIRLIAINGLLLMQDEATAYVLGKRPALASAMNAWLVAYRESKIDGLIEVLHRNDGATAPIAAFALGFFDLELARETLLKAFADPNTDRDVGWAIADTFATLDPQWVSHHVLEPRLDQFVDPRVPYLVGRMGMAAEGTAQRQYLSDCFNQGTPSVQARALRAFGELREASIRPLCQAVTSDNWDAARGLGLNLPPELAEDDRNRLRNAAMESLRKIGNADSIETLRKARLAGSMTITLRQLSFDVAEDIYWRLTAGLSNETFDTNPVSDREGS